MGHPWDAIVWWEFRRIPFNAAVALAALASIAVIAVVGAPHLEPGEDLIEPLMLIFGSIAFALIVNLAYSLGWITELIWAWGDTTRTEHVRPRVFRLGLRCSIAVTLLPAVLVPVSWAVFGFH